jgi:two-component system, NtrC family, response regulator AtoC
VSDQIEIAIVDDEPTFARYLAAFLEARGYAPSTFTSGRAFLDALESGADPDVALLDVLMPGMDGLATLRVLRAQRPNLQVIMLSGSQLPATIVDAVRLGAVDYVVKPDDPDGLGEAALEATIRSAVEKVRLTDEVARLKAQISDDPDGAQPCWGSGAAMRNVLTMVERVAASDVGVLISGESGVGKEIIARELHRQSDRRTQPFVKVNCAALPADLLESELFGHEKGAFTGAASTRQGRFEFAAGGTILLDEIGEMPRSLQPKLLHVLQDRAVARLGSNRMIPVDVRVLAATNRNLMTMIEQGQFREDLYYRLQVIELRVPPLRERRDEILPLVEFFSQRYSSRYGKTPVRMSQALRTALAEHPWPGNVRQLENVMKRFVILQDEDLILGELQRSAANSAPPTSDVDTAPGEIEPAAVRTRDRRGPSPVPSGGTLLDVARRAAVEAERRLIEETLLTCRWNRRKAARVLGVSYKTLLNKIREQGLMSSDESKDADRLEP